MAQYRDSKGQLHEIREMATPHIDNALRKARANKQDDVIAHLQWEIDLRRLPLWMVVRLAGTLKEAVFRGLTHEDAWKKMGELRTADTSGHSFSVEIEGQEPQPSKE